MKPIGNVRIMPMNVSREEWEKARGEDGEYTARYVIGKVRTESVNTRRYADRHFTRLTRQTETLRAVVAVQGTFLAAVVTLIVGAGFKWWSL